MIGQFAAGRGAEVEHAFAGLRIEFAHGQQRAGVLHVEQTLLKAGQPAQRRMRFQLEDQVLFEPIPADEVIFHTFVAPLGQEFAGVGLQGVDAGEGLRRRVVPFHQLRRAVGAPAFLPAGHQPFRMGIAKVRLLCLQLGQQAPGGVELAQVAAQDGIDESRLGVKAALPGQLDGFVDGGMVGDAIEPEDLVKAEPQQVLQRWASAGARPSCGRSANRGSPASGRCHRPVPGTGGGRRAKAASGPAPLRAGSSTKSPPAPRCRMRNAISLGFSPLTTFNKAVLLRGRER